MHEGVVVSSLTDVICEPSGSAEALPLTLSCRWNNVFIVRLALCVRVCFEIVCLGFCLGNTVCVFVLSFWLVDGSRMRRRRWINTISFARGTGAAPAVGLRCNGVGSKRLRGVEVVLGFGSAINKSQGARRGV